MDDRVRRELHDQAGRIQPDVEMRLAAVVERTSSHRRPRLRGLLRLTGATTLGLAGAAVVLIVVVPLLLLRVSAPPLGGPGSSPSASPVGEGLLGRYVTMLADAGDVHTLGLAGTWTLEFTPDKTILLTPPSTYPGGGQPLSGVSYSLTPRGLRTNLLIEVCGSVGEYGWQHSDEGLAFTPDVDTCDLRRVLLTTAIWHAA